MYSAYWASRYPWFLQHERLRTYPPTHPLRMGCQFMGRGISPALFLKPIYTPRTRCPVSVKDLAQEHKLLEWGLREFNTRVSVYLTITHCTTWKLHTMLPSNPILHVTQSRSHSARTKPLSLSDERFEINIPLSQWWYELERKGWCMALPVIHCKSTTNKKKSVLVSQVKTSVINLWTTGLETNGSQPATD